MPAPAWADQDPNDPFEIPPFDEKKLPKDFRRAVVPFKTRHWPGTIIINTGSRQLFIVLEGQMSVFDETGNEIKVEKHQGVMIPKGAYYRYHNTGKDNLVVIRVGAGIKGKPQGGVEMRVRPDGKPLLAESAENKTVEPIYDTRFFADSAG